jgi:hypothetical protein
MEWEKKRRKASYDGHRHDKLKFSVGEVAVMRIAYWGVYKALEPVQRAFDGIWRICSTLISKLLLMMNINSIKG